MKNGLTSLQISLSPEAKEVKEEKSKSPKRNIKS